MEPLSFLFTVWGLFLLYRGVSYLGNLVEVFKEIRDLLKQGVPAPKIEKDRRVL